AFFFLFVPALAAQEYTVSGVVIAAEDNSPLIAATVLLKGSKTSVKTDKNGVFTLKADGSAWLVVQYNGFKTVEVPVRQRTLVDVVLHREDETDEQAFLLDNACIK
ncbi:MAG: carboxypeptidase-like regulatory domain-containing protein, partial [Candidatus Thermochlorobacter sp.]